MGKNNNSHSPPPKRIKQIKVMLDEQMVRDLQDLALEEDRTVSDLVRRLCALHLYGHARSLDRRQEKTMDRES